MKDRIDQGGKFADQAKVNSEDASSSKGGDLGWVSLGVIILALLMAVFGPILAPFDPNTGDLAFANVGPFGQHLLGFDGQGRDVLSRLLVGARTAVFGAAAVALVAVVIGTALALVTALAAEHPAQLALQQAVATAAHDALYAATGENTSRKGR